MGLFGPKWQKMEVFRIFFSRTTHQIFLIFCSKHSLWCRKKRRFRFFWEISKMALFGQNWPKFGLNLAISGYIRPEARVFKKIFVKNFEKIFFLIFFFKIEKKLFRAKKIHIFPYEHHYDSPLLTLRTNLKFLKWMFFALFFEKNQKFYYFFISLVEIWLV